ncbi:hemoglobin/transferrin/lactoferrin receptor protein [Methylopila jiangsuensis]|uniref:TonB-dependent receptor n=1 Tax=Methylopila jiangsuensis TaxID=586230 RepID=UPI0022F34668|nr:TonB-dependent receptor [Methylopila jiangsuensis]MDR6285969.1 hemoglobin/transferrin/lactoferrin receptor protein [Methylopila jiangsuensis]
MTSGHRNGRGVAARLAASLLAGAALTTSGGVKAQTAPERPFSIPAGRLGDALAAFGRQAGLQLAYRPDLATGKTTAGLTGPATPDAALRRLLAGTGLTYQLTSARTAVITAPAASVDDAPDADGSLVLSPIQITGAGGVSPADAPYVTPASTAHISAETIERFRGSSPADIFRGTPGVLSGEARNGAGAIDVNIRGMQGMGRVATTIDGAENAMTIYQGYQGVSNRTYMDPDLLGGVDIIKGSDAASFGVAGTVAMRTLNASDLVEDGRDYGVRVKGGFGTNTTKPSDNAQGGYSWPSWAGAPAVATPSSNGMDRPGFLEPSSGFGSAVAAVKQENYELIGGFAYRKQGNYFAGKNGGDGAKPVHTGPRTVCSSTGWCQGWTDYVENGGLTNYRAGEEVLNTQLETKSWLFKGTVRFDDDQSLQVGYTGFRADTGSQFASRLTDERSQPYQLALSSKTDLDTLTSRYRWAPADNPLIDLKANVYWSQLEVRGPNPVSYAVYKRGDFRPGSDTDMWGGEISNLSKLHLAYGDLDLTYGVAYRGEDTRPGKGTRAVMSWLDPRDAVRNEAAGFVKSSFKPVDWLTLNGGLRYTHFWSKDRNDPGEDWDRGYDYRVKRSEGGFSPSVGVTVEPLAGVQLYTNYSSTLRAPSIIEAATGFTMGVSPNVKPERSRNWEIGANFRKEGLYAADDKGMMKLSYFNWDVKNYISRHYTSYELNGALVSGMQIFNIDRAKFEGLKFSGVYENAGFKAEFTANYYLDVTFCRTADACESKSLYSDYSTNHVPPEYSLSLTASQEFWKTLTLGGRVQHVGKRAIGHGDATAQGMSQFIALVDWKPYTLVDVFATYKINEYFTANVGVENLTDKYYVDPLSLVLQPAPGRTFTASLTAKF